MREEKEMKSEDWILVVITISILLVGFDNWMVEAYIKTIRYETRCYINK